MFVVVDQLLEVPQESILWPFLTIFLNTIAHWVQKWHITKLLILRTLPIFKMDLKDLSILYQLYYSNESVILICAQITFLTECLL